MVDYKKRKLEEEKTLPSFRCFSCHNLVELGFDPKSKVTGGAEKWASFRCPKCKTKNTEEHDVTHPSQGSIS